MPCAAHTLNLVVADAARSSQERLVILDIYIRCSLYFQHPPRDGPSLKNHVEMTLKS